MMITVKNNAPVLDAALQKVPSEEQKIHRICFVCTGNTCRSPMAAALYNYLHEDEPTEACSAGLSVFPGEPIALNALLALKGRGVISSAKNNYEAHEATPFSHELLDRVDDVYALSSRHYMALCISYPEDVQKFHLLGEIADPYGASLDRYQQTLAEIEEAFHVQFRKS